jgi:hypothetical protein
VSAGDSVAEQAYDQLLAGNVPEATALALQAIRWELRTANLIAAAQLQGAPPLDLSGYPAGLARQAAAERAQLLRDIARELDIEATS